MEEVLLFAVRGGSVAIILLNVSAGRYGDAAIAGMSIVTRICMFINSFVIGFGQGFQPVCGFNYGAEFYSRVRQGFWFCVKLGVVFLICCSVAGYIYAPEIVSWFRKGDVQVIEVGASALRLQLITLPLGAWVILCNMLLQTIRKPVRAVLLSSARQGLFFIPLILLLPFCLGLQGVEMTQAVADLCSFLLALPLTGPVLRAMRADAPTILFFFPEKVVGHLFRFFVVFVSYLAQIHRKSLQGYALRFLGTEVFCNFANIRIRT